ncbi:ribosome biogenesis protein MRT4, putative [Plasmodium chabaudi chabaudi]|uniref:Ribosome biogenesis protein MRT4, putative n=1 Tax=Plasmodium chabaudi chabaudi TaxID=31271 RepID=A0A077TQS7_PLACU|nr:ribosome biogenesis protein MRT4, putative [Plasmodium chabaudi chabaudi]SCM24126.1 ribosome biogenesis protein MRT4, putative [Plasmodium chabaudi chabaudi]SCN61608.1 ribosome biogenesis protein MRT4, putative [Plasmodium chabaudi chabaudi]VTZ69423.1 ribosome biogenesis protein MRT4, putative [Plasmodium chabaudi chabaudi]|eukprot:XP_016654101.1 ribosome biogenesis protein MRT4, putative [Plasmodium chabaudi chabaudi]
MPKSKRNITISLTKVKKKLNKKELKDQKFSELKKHASIQNIYIYALDVRTHSNNNLKKVIEYFKPSGGKFFIGKNKLMKLALGDDEKHEIKPNVSKIAELLVGNRILLITKDEPLKVIKFFNEFQPEEYIIHGNISKEDITLKCGDVLNVPVSMQKDLQKLKVNFDIVDQKIIIKEDKVLAEKDKLVSLENAKLLRMLNMKIGKFDISVLAYWHLNNFVSLMQK